jgi:hypothetical protein
MSSVQSVTPPEARSSAVGQQRLRVMAFSAEPRGPRVSRVARAALLYADEAVVVNMQIRELMQRALDPDVDPNPAVRRVFERYRDVLKVRAHEAVRTDASDATPWPGSRDVRGRDAFEEGILRLGLGGISYHDEDVSELELEKTGEQLADLQTPEELEQGDWQGAPPSSAENSLRYAMGGIGLTWLWRYVQGDDSLRVLGEFPILDRQGLELLSAVSVEYQPAEPQVLSVREGFFAGELLGRLPAFPDADLDVLADVRQSLQRPLVRFRQALRSAARDLNELEPKDLPGAAETLRRADVAPAIADIEETLEDLKAIPTLLRLASNRATVASISATVATVIAGITGNLDLSAALAAVGAPATVAGAAQEGLARRAIERQATNKPYWFLYETERRFREQR